MGVGVWMWWWPGKGNQNDQSLRFCRGYSNSAWRGAPNGFNRLGTCEIWWQHNFWQWHMWIFQVLLSWLFQRTNSVLGSPLSPPILSTAQNPYFNVLLLQFRATLRNSVKQRNSLPLSCAPGVSIMACSYGIEGFAMQRAPFNVGLLEPHLTLDQMRCAAAIGWNSPIWPILRPLRPDFAPFPVDFWIFGRL